jgi:hypothetical protein
MQRGIKHLTRMVEMGSFYDSFSENPNTCNFPASYSMHTDGCRLIWDHESMHCKTTPEWDGGREELSQRGKIDISRL